MKKLSALTVDVLYEIYSKYFSNINDKKNFRIIKSYTDSNLSLFQETFPSEQEDEMRYSTRLHIIDNFVWLTNNAGSAGFIINIQMNEDLKSLGYEINYNNDLQMA